MSKNIFIVNCDKNTFESSFSRKRNSDIINYHEIRQRLTNNDVFKTPPSPDVVEFQIIKKLHSFKRCKKTEFLFFYVDSISETFVENLKGLLNECEFTLNFHLLIDSDQPVPHFHKEFHTIQTLEK